MLHQFPLLGSWPILAKNCELIGGLGLTKTLRFDSEQQPRELIDTQRHHTQHQVTRSLWRVHALEHGGYRTHPRAERCNARHLIWFVALRFVRRKRPLFTDAWVVVNQGHATAGDVQMQL